MAVAARVFTSLVTALLSAGVALAFAPGCGTSSSTFTPGDAVDGSIPDGTIGPNPFADGGTGGPCTGLACQVDKNCGNAGPTTLTGTVFAPNGTLPLYNAVVFVPNAPLDPIPEGPSCDHCGNVSGQPIAATLTDTSGHFELKNVPYGTDIPLVVQIGKWRREIKIANVPRCASTPVDKTMTRLPKNQSEGHIPKIAVTTGVCDHLACLLPKLGLDASEYSSNTGPGRLHLYQGSGDTCAAMLPDAGADAGGSCTGAPAPAPSGTPSASTLWKDYDSLKRYDMVILSCECNEHNEMKPDSAKLALYDYAKAGGRVFASHFHYTWFQNSPVQDLKDLATWVGDSPFGHALGGTERTPSGNFLVDQSFPKGQALADWLVNVAASTTKGEIPINQPRADVVGVNKAKGATRWVYNAPDGLPETTKYLSFNAPVDQPVENQCGKVVFGDMHITGQLTTTLPDNKFPASCPTVLTPEEKALIFLFFDLASCVQKEDEPPPVPVIK